MNPTTDAACQEAALRAGVATSLGLGYLPKAPGTWGSLMGVLLALGGAGSLPACDRRDSPCNQRWWSNFAVRGMRAGRRRFPDRRLGRGRVATLSAFDTTRRSW